MYRLKSHSGLIEKILWLLALGVDASAIEEVFGVREMTIRTWRPAKFTPELMDHLDWWRSYYHFVRPHESLEEELSQPIKRKGKRQSKKYRKRTPAMMAGLTDRRWMVKDLLLYPLP